MQVAAISYNMSVFSAMGYAGNLVKIGAAGPRNRLAAGMPPFPSEARFLRRAVQEKDLQTGLTVTDFFMNAVNHLHTQVEELNKKTPVVMIGIQEFYPPTGPIILRGPLASYSSWVFNSDNLASWKNTMENNYGNKYGQKLKGIPNDASMLTLWDANKLGPMVNHYDKDLGEGGAPADGGRPISIILTEKGYVLVNFHGINRPRFNPGASTDGTLSNKDNGAELKLLVSKCIGEAMAKFKAETPGLMINTNKIIITCDSNDRTHSFSKGGSFLIDGVEFNDGHPGGLVIGLPTHGAKACCYNYDSVGLPFPKSSTVRNGVNANVEPGVPQTMGVEGAEVNYAYTGDYILAANPVINPGGGVVAVPSPQDEQGASVASDHMMVYALLDMPLQGGRRRKTRKQKRSKRTTRQRQTRQK